MGQLHYQIKTFTKSATLLTKRLPSEEEEGPNNVDDMKLDGESRNEDNHRHTFYQPGILSDLTHGMSEPCLNLGEHSKLLQR
jgi:hypothetical protein